MTSLPTQELNRRRMVRGGAKVSFDTGRMNLLLNPKTPIDLFRRTIAFGHDIVRRTYNEKIWPHLPERSNSPYPQYNGIAVGVGRRRLFDSVVSWSTPSSDKPDYEAPLITALCQETDYRDRVVIVGGGLGVSSVVAANQVGSEGKVIVYEGVSEQIEILNKTIEINGVKERCDVRHAIVGPDIGTYGSTQGSKTISPADLPECDVLELDCEGSEKEILRDMKIRPRIIVVEIHTNKGITEESIQDILVQRGYRVTSRKMERPVWFRSLAKYGIKTDSGIYILTGVLQSDD